MRPRGRPKKQPTAVPKPVPIKTKKRTRKETKQTPKTSPTITPDSPQLRAKLASLKAERDDTLCSLCGLGFHIPKVVYENRRICLVCREMVARVPAHKRAALYALDEMRLKTLRLRWYSDYAIDPHAFDHWLDEAN